MFWKVTNCQALKVAPVKIVKQTSFGFRFDSGSVKRFSEQRDQSRLLVRPRTASLNPTLHRHLHENWSKCRHFYKQDQYRLPGMRWIQRNREKEGERLLQCNSNKVSPNCEGLIHLKLPMKCPLLHNEECKNENGQKFTPLVHKIMTHNKPLTAKRRPDLLQHPRADWLVCRPLRMSTCRRR